MSELPQVARWYLYIVWVVAGLMVLMVVQGTSLDYQALGFFGFWLFVYICADYVEFQIGNERPVSMTIADAPMMCLVALSGLQGSLVILLGTVIVDLLKRQREWYRSLFNASARVITYCTMWVTYQAIMPADATAFSGVTGIFALICVGCVYYLLNTLLIATIVALASQRPLFEVYRNSYQVVQWIHFVTLPLGAAMAALWQLDRWLVLPALIPLVMAQRSFQTQAELQAESRRSKALASEARQLTNKLERLQDATTAMIASLDVLLLLKTVSTRLAALLEASASWVVLLENQRARLVATNGLNSDCQWNANGYISELYQGLRVLDRAELGELHLNPNNDWESLVIIPLALDKQVRGGICLAIDRKIQLDPDDRRVLMSFAAQATLAMEHARLFEELRLKQDELVRSSKLAALGTFSAGIAHEFNNLLAGILGYAQLGLNSNLVEDKNEALEVAVRSCKRGRSITSGLLTFARRDDPQRGEYLLQSTVEDMIVLVERELAKMNIRIEKHIEEVPPVICDTGQIAQVVLNLLTNARDAMTDLGGVIEVSLRSLDGWVELVVKDNGCGIPAELLDQVFQPFMTTKGALGGSVTPGAGLGLAISYGIIQSHHGTIEIDSLEHYGTTVTVRLPMSSTEQQNNSQQIDLLTVPRLNILVVDDEQAILDSVERLLRGAGHQVVSVNNAMSALQHYREGLFDLVISDIILPGMNGVDFAKHLRMIDSRARILIMTGQVDSARLEQLRQYGINNIIIKPFVVEELLSSVAQTFEENVKSFV
jgi:two-component system NtrC family sensor kinase